MSKIITVPDDIIIEGQHLSFLQFVAMLLNDPQWGSKYSLLEINHALRVKFDNKQPGEQVEISDTELNQLKIVIENPTNKYNLAGGLTVLKFFRLFTA